ncbi:Hsp20/alpha crystallin family protein [Horticoccus luteus]|uniref:Hsp20/alpha crystallin family protein n=1 Tax=Horticoccus luteus TaxID=2862869 RepID=A0A8F9TXI7_9BACT|nr:Hsp20/alpha crystallin family protein [Horticoccus luteus]QYM79955.1 Hsp20/alpha crystallin family protein [Horticoccus luteus]
MHSIVAPLRSVARSRSAASPSSVFRKPNYDCREQPDALKLVIYVPGVEAGGVDIEWRGADLTVTARKAHYVRVNWQALHLETAQRDYQLRLRLGHDFDVDNLRAEIAHGLLTLTVPKLEPAHGRWPAVA